MRAHGAGLACPDWPLCFGAGRSRVRPAGRRSSGGTACWPPDSRWRAVGLAVFVAARGRAAPRFGASFGWLFGPARGPDRARRADRAAGARALDGDRAPAGRERLRGRRLLWTRARAAGVANGPRPRASESPAVARLSAVRGGRCSSLADRARRTRLEPLRRGWRAATFPTCDGRSLRADLHGSGRHPRAAPAERVPAAAARSAGSRSGSRAASVRLGALGAVAFALVLLQIGGGRGERAAAPADRGHRAALRRWRPRSCCTTRADAARSSCWRGARGPSSRARARVLEARDERAADYLALTKPRLLPLVLFSGLPALVMRGRRLAAVRGGRRRRWSARRSRPARRTR